MKRVISVLKSVFFPKTCAGCGEIINEDDELCDYCHEMLVRCDPLKRCMRCGLKKDDCQCKNQVFAFEMCIAPFVNDGVAKRANVSLQIPPQNDLRHYACKANGALR